jgi:hypothetical protein
VEALERLRSVLAFCGKRLGGADPLVLLPQALDTIAGALESQKSEIDAFISDRNQTHLTNANSAADTALAQVAYVPAGISTPEELIGLIDATTTYRDRVEEQERASSTSRKQATGQIKEVASAVEGLREQTQSTIAEIKAQLDAERQKVASQASEQQKLFADAQEVRSKTFNDTLLKIQDSLTKALSDQQGQFSTAQENRNREFTAAQTESQKRFGDLIADYTKRLTDQDAEFSKQRSELGLVAQQRLGDLNSTFQTEAERILAEVNKHRQDIEKLVGVIGNLGVTSGYQTTANRARHSMWIWQGATVAALCGLVYFAYHAFLPSIQGDFRWESFAARVFLTVTVGVLAAYAGTQADRFFHMEKSNRKLALELAAIDPFIALLPQEEQYKFKLEIGRRSFAQEEVAIAESDKSPANTLDLLTSPQMKQLLELLGALSKLTKGS